ncbi:hypothetical protein A1Q2_06375 [Trichosporon asahii var. asahii CBS 8904]|uniref:Uncharacterized protein n=1 Tax=Trichosporon asahii var. asahii (strain CBS 8904) TaxID=1220162 RepID=K1WCS5_TRIAC|nr:hypothetical protein A1Q2_06375 [Trichosporon asahii var. asahii CBS 8904]
MPATRKVSKSIKQEDVKPYDRPKSPPASSSKNKARTQLPDGSKAALARAVVAAGVKALTNEEAAQISGLSLAQVKKQLEAGRGVRRALLEFADTLG